MGLFNTVAFRPIVFLPQQVPSFISRGATHHRDARDLYQRRRELLPMNFASKSLIHENSLGSFTCRKAGTWDIFFYFLSEGRHTEDFPDARKIQRLRPGLNPRIRVPVAMLTTRPPKPSSPENTDEFYYSPVHFTHTLVHAKPYPCLHHFQFLLAYRKIKRLVWCTEFPPLSLAVVSK